MDKPKVIVICGPTASGKTALSIELAKKIDGEIISCDSMQIYKDMNIGTAKVTKSEMQGIKHYLVDFVSPDTRYSVADYKTDAEKAIENIISKGKIPIIVGGTGLYVDSLIYGIEYPEIKFDEEYRKKLEKEAEEGLENLYNKAKEIDEQAMQKISINDRKRIIRVLEIYHATGKNKTEQEKESRKKEVKYDYKIFAINIDREKLYERINIRVDKMIENMIFSNPDFENAVQFLCTIPSVKRDSAITIISEISIDMSQFSSSKRLCCWAGLTPGSNESAGKKKSVRITRAGVYLKPALIQCAHAAVKSDKSPYRKKKYESLAKRRDKKRAIIAIARMILTAIYQMLSTGEVWNPSDLYKIDMPIPLVEKQKAKAIKQAKPCLPICNTVNHKWKILL